MDKQLIIAFVVALKAKMNGREVTAEDKKNPSGCGG